MRDRWAKANAANATSSDTVNQTGAGKLIPNILVPPCKETADVFTLIVPEHYSYADEEKC